MENNHENKNRKTQKINLKNDKTTKNYRTKSVFNIIFNIVLFMCQISICSAMFAGLGVVLAGFGISGLLNFCVKVSVVFICFLFLHKGRNGVYVFNTVLSLIMIVFVLLICILSFVKGEFNFAGVGTFKDGLLYMPLLYVGMNILTAYPLLCEVGKDLKSKKDRVMTSLFVGLFIFLCLILVCTLLLVFGGDFLSEDMPLILITIRVSNFLAYVYVFVVLLGILTTLFSTAYGATSLLRGRINYKLSLCLILAFGLSFVGFSKIIDFVYPALGLICLVVMVFKLKRTKNCCK